MVIQGGATSVPVPVISSTSGVGSVRSAMSPILPPPLLAAAVAGAATDAAASGVRFPRTLPLDPGQRVPVGRGKRAAHRVWRPELAGLAIGFRDRIGEIPGRNTTNLFA